MILNKAEFFANLDAFIEEDVPKQVVLVQKKLAFDIFAGVIHLSPVKTGRYRAAHTMSVGEPDETVPPEVHGKKVLPKPKNPGHGLHLVPKLDALTVVWIGNHLPYSERLEDGHSGQAAAGVYGPVLAAVEAGLSDAGLLG